MAAHGQPRKGVAIWVGLTAKHAVSISRIGGPIVKDDLRHCASRQAVVRDLRTEPHLVTKLHFQNARLGLWKPSLLASPSQQRQNRSQGVQKRALRGRPQKHLSRRSDRVIEERGQAVSSQHMPAAARLAIGQTIWSGLSSAGPNLGRTYAMPHSGRPGTEAAKARLLRIQ
jgi:hypothetical protein